MNPPTLPDTLEWQTEVLTDPTDFAGDIELQLDATITALDAAWITVLYDVAPDGAATPSPEDGSEPPCVRSTPSATAKVHQFSTAPILSRCRSAKR